MGQGILRALTTLSRLAPLLLPLCGCSHVLPQGTFTTHQAFLEESRKDKPAFSDPMEVFHYVLERLPAKPFVYPTENYYYFRFYRNGWEIRGNLRFDPQLLDEGRLAFCYYPHTESPRDRRIAYANALLGGGARGLGEARGLVYG